MKITQRIKKIISFYDTENAGIKNNLCHILMNGCLGGSGRIVILSSEEGLLNGPAISFSTKEQGYDPLYHFQLAKDIEVSAYSATLGMIEAGADSYAGSVPLILKINTANSLANNKIAPTQAITASVKDALRLGCSGIGFTIYPGSDRADEMFEDFRAVAEEAKACGLCIVVFAYPSGGFISREGETSLDTCAYSAYIAANLGAHIINVPMPSKNIEQPQVKKIYKDSSLETSFLAERIRHTMQVAFNGRRIVTFSDNQGLADTNKIIDDAKAIREGGGYGSFLGPNLFQRSKNESKDLMEKLTTVYAGEKIDKKEETN